MIYNSHYTEQLVQQREYSQITKQNPAYLITSTKYTFLNYTIQNLIKKQGWAIIKTQEVKQAYCMNLMVPILIFEDYKLSQQKMLKFICDIVMEKCSLEKKMLRTNKILRIYSRINNILKTQKDKNGIEQLLSLGIYDNKSYYNILYQLLLEIMELGQQNRDELSIENIFFVDIINSIMTLCPQTLPDHLFRGYFFDRLELVTTIDKKCQQLLENEKINIPTKKCKLAKRPFSIQLENLHYPFWNNVFFLYQMGGMIQSKQLIIMNSPQNCINISDCIYNNIICLKCYNIEESQLKLPGQTIKLKDGKQEEKVTCLHLCMLKGITQVAKFSNIYYPEKNDYVICTVKNKNAQSYTLDLNAPLDGQLGVLQFDGATKRNRPNIAIGGSIYGRIIQYNRYTGGKLSCINKGYNKKNELGQIRNGAFIVIPAYKHYLIEDKLQWLKRQLNFKILLAKNGIIWVISDSIKASMVLRNILIQIVWGAPNDLLANMIEVAKQ